MLHSTKTTQLLNSCDIGEEKLKTKIKQTNIQKKWNNSNNLAHYANIIN